MSKLKVIRKYKNRKCLSDSTQRWKSGDLIWIIVRQSFCMHFCIKIFCIKLTSRMQGSFWSLKKLSLNGSWSFAQSCSHRQRFNMVYVPSCWPDLYIWEMKQEQARQAQKLWLWHSWRVCWRQTEWVQGAVRHITSFLFCSPAEHGCCRAHVSHALALLFSLCVTLTHGPVSCLLSYFHGMLDITPKNVHQSPYAPCFQKDLFLLF